MPADIVPGRSVAKLAETLLGRYVNVVGGCSVPGHFDLQWDVVRVVAMADRHI